MALQTQDKAAGLTGLIVGAAAIFLILIGIIALTNKKFEGHGETAAAEATK
jgi:hypothetical protein